MRSLEQRLQTNSSGAGPGRSVDRAGWAPQEGRAPVGVRGGRVPQRRWAVTRWKAQAATTPSREASPSAPGAALRFPSRPPEPEPEPGKATGTPPASPRAWGVCLPLPGGHAPCTCGPSSQAREGWKAARFLLRPVLLRPLHSPVLSCPGCFPPWGHSLRQRPCPHSPNRLVLLGWGMGEDGADTRGRQWEKPASPLTSPAGSPLPALARPSVGGRLTLAHCVPAGPRSSVGLLSSATFPVLDNASHLCAPGAPRAPMIWKKTA